jgi:hypothetical protein
MHHPVTYEVLMTSRRFLLPLAVVVVLAACGGSHKATGVFAVEKGMTRAQVRSVAGAPGPSPSGKGCWFYHATKKGTSIDGMRFCFSRGKVALMQTALHG